MTIAIVLLPSSRESSTSTVATQTVFGLSRLIGLAALIHHKKATLIYLNSGPRCFC